MCGTGRGRLGIASQHRVYAALREFCNFEVRKTRRLAFNPIYVVELEPEQRDEAQRWTAGQAARFLAATAQDPLGLLFRIVVLRGARRGEVCGMRWCGVDFEAGTITIGVTLLLVGKAVIGGRPKTRTSKRVIYLDAATVELLRAHRKAQLAVRLRAGEARPDLLYRPRRAAAARLRVTPVQAARHGRGGPGDQAARGTPQRGQPGAGRGG